MTRTILSLAIILLAGCSDSAEAEVAYSALPEIETLRPVIACIEKRVENTQEQEVWSGGVPKGPAQSKETLNACASDLEFDFGRSVQKGDPFAARDSVMFWAIMSFGDYRDHLSTADFDFAMDAARCVESSVAENGGLSPTGSRKSDETAQRALRKCIQGVAEIEADPAAIPSRRDSLALSIARLNLNHIRARMSANLAEGNND